MAVHYFRTRAWRRILARHYDQVVVHPEQSRRCYSLHFFYAAEGRSFVLSRVRKDRGRVAFPVQFQVIDRLFARGVGTVRLPFPPVDSGVPWVATHRHFWFVRIARAHDIHAWRSGEPASDAARALSDIHRAGIKLWTRDEAARLFRAERLDPYHWSVLDVLAGFDQVLSRLTRRSLLRNEVEAVRSVAEMLRHDPPLEALGPIGLTHQDFRPENLLVHEGRVAEVVDWDRARPDHQLYDAVLAGILLASHGRLPGAAEVKRARCFVDTYLSVRGLRIEKHAVDWMFQFTAVKNICLSRSPRKWVEVFRVLEHMPPSQGHLLQPAGIMLEPAPTAAG